MSTDGTVQYAQFGGEKKPFNTLRIWKILTLISTLVALAVTALFIWYVLTHKTEKSGKNVPEKSTSTADTLPCPQFPTLFPLPKTTPKRLTDVFEKLEAVFSAAVDKKSSLPAISANVFYQNRILWSGHFGSKVYKEPEMKPNGSTVYRIGSVTKVFAVLLMYKLYEEGKIASIDDPLSKYAPDFAIKNPYTNENITLREIASQMSGLPREAPCMYHCSKTNSKEQLALLTNRTLVWPPWKTPSYSNLGYALLGRLLTENLLRNKTFESWTMDNIIKPLGMVNTGFEITDEVEKNMAYPYLPGGKKMPFTNFGWLAPAVQIYSTIDDLAKLGMMFAQPDKQKLFKPATLKEMMTPKDITPDGVTVWGSPFEMLFKQHVLIRTKGGNIDTYSATFIVIPELALGANILISTVYYGHSTASQRGVLLYNRLVAALNETLFEIQRSSHFPIDPTPYLGKFNVTETDPISGKKVSFIVNVKTVENILRFDYPKASNMWQEIRYIGESLVFQSRYRTPGMSCLLERVGTLSALYYEPLAKDNLSPGFHIPERLIVATRLTNTEESFTEEFEDKMERFTVNQFKSAI